MTQVVVIGSCIVGGFVVVRVVWCRLVQYLVDNDYIDAIDNGDGTGYMF